MLRAHWRRWRWQNQGCSSGESGCFWLCFKFVSSPRFLLKTKKYVRYVFNQVGEVQGAVKAAQESGMSQRRACHPFAEGSWGQSRSLPQPSRSPAPRRRQRQRLPPAKLPDLEPAVWPLSFCNAWPWDSQGANQNMAVQFIRTGSLSWCHRLDQEKGGGGLMLAFGLFVSKIAWKRQSKQTFWFLTWSCCRFERCDC